MERMLCDNLYCEERYFMMQIFCYGILASKALVISCEGRLRKMFSRVGLRNMDFLKYSGIAVVTGATALYAHPCTDRAFRDIHVPQSLFYRRNIKKISDSCAGQLREHFVQSAMSVNERRLLVPESFYKISVFEIEVANEFSEMPDIS